MNCLDATSIDVYVHASLDTAQRFQFVPTEHAEEALLGSSSISKVTTWKTMPHTVDTAGSPLMVTVVTKRHSDRPRTPERNFCVSVTLPHVLSWTRVILHG
jgi:hypothetical protein